MAPSEQTAGLSGPLRENIAALTERERREREQAPLSERLAERITRFTGSMPFVVLHLILFGGWIVANLGWLTAIPRFDPTFVTLAMVASVEAIFLSTFVLITQNRMAAAADRRADLDLHISLLTEHELTRLAALVDRIAERLDVPVDKAEFAEIERDVTPVEVLEALDEKRAQDDAG